MGKKKKGSLVKFTGVVETLKKSAEIKCTEEITFEYAGEKHRIGIAGEYEKIKVSFFKYRFALIDSTIAYYFDDRNYSSVDGLLRSVYLNNVPLKDFSEIVRVYSCGAELPKDNAVMAKYIVEDENRQ